MGRRAIHHQGTRPVRPWPDAEQIQGRYSTTIEWSSRGLNPSLHALGAGELPPGAHVGLTSKGKRQRYSICPAKGTAKRYQFALYAIPPSITIPARFVGIKLLEVIADAPVSGQRRRRRRVRRQLSAHVDAHPSGAITPQPLPTMRGSRELAPTERNVKLAFALGLVAIAVAVAVVLSEARLTVLSASPVEVNRELTVANRGLTACQSSEALPKAPSRCASRSVASTVRR